MFEDLLSKVTGTGASVKNRVKKELSIGEWKERVSENPIRSALYAFTALGFSSHEIVEWVQTLDPAWLVSLQNLADQHLGGLPVDVEALTVLTVLGGLLGADRIGKFVQRFTEPRKAFDNIVHMALSQSQDNDVKEDEE